MTVSIVGRLDANVARGLLHDDTEDHASMVKASAIGPRQITASLEHTGGKGGTVLLNTNLLRSMDDSVPDSSDVFACVTSPGHLTCCTKDLSAHPVVSHIARQRNETREAERSRRWTRRGV